MSDLERRFLKPAKSSVKLERRADGDAEGAATIEGYGAVYYDAQDPSGTQYELWEGMLERILPGAFDDAVDSPECVSLFNHDSNLVLGSVRGKSLALKSDAKGLWYSVELPAAQYARDLAAVVGRGDVPGSSIMFRVAEQQWREVDGVTIREIVKMEPLIEVGPVVFPAYSGTSTEVAKRSLEEHRRRSGRPLLAAAERWLRIQRLKGA